MCDIIENSDNLPNNQCNFTIEMQNEENTSSFINNTYLKDIPFTKLTEKRENLRIKAIEEILSSEISYLKHLELLIEYFTIPLKANNFLSVMDYNTIFGNIETIYNINEELLNQLKEDVNNYATAFLKLGPFLKLYSVYAYDYKKCISLLEESKLNNKEFMNFIVLQETKIQMKLPSLLITPIQRIPRYRLLLKQVLEHTPTHHSDYKLILESLEKVENTAKHMNSLVEEQENTESMLTIQKSLHDNYPCIIKVGRKLIKEGMLMKMAQKKNKYHQRYFILMSDILMYCKPLKPDPKLPNSLECCCILPINKCQINVLNKGLFNVNCEDEHLYLYSENEKESEKWIEALQKAVQYYLDCRKTLRKESSARKPVRKKRLMEYEQLNISPGVLRQKRCQEIGDDIFYGKVDESDDDITEKKSCFLKRNKKRPLSENFNNISLQLPKKVKFSTENEFFGLTPNKSFLFKKIVPMKSSPSTSKANKENENMDIENTTNISKIHSVFTRIKCFVQKYFQS